MGSWINVLAWCVGLAIALALVGLSLFLLLIDVMKLPRLPKELDSKRQLRVFLIKNAFFMGYIFLKGKLNGKSMMVNVRAAMDSWMKPQPSVVPGSKVKSSTRILDGVKVRVYEPIIKEASNNLPGLLFFHGGGFVAGSADAYDPVTRKMADTIAGVVVSVDYRLAPENPFPAGFDDCMTATKYFFKNCQEFGVDPTRVAICGDSAGGNLAAGVVQELCYKTNKSQGMCRPKLQILLYPVLQMFDISTPSYQKHDAAFGIKGGFLPTSSMVWLLPRYLTGSKDGSITKALLNGSLRGWAEQENDVLQAAINHDLIPAKLKGEAYVKRAGGADPESKAMWEKLRPSVLDNRIMPLYKDDLSQLPPAYIVTCDFDILRDDGVMYAERLKKAGVEATLENYVGAIHGLMFFGQFKWGRDARKKFYSYLSKAL